MEACGGCAIPKRVLDGEGIWGSDKLAKCPRLYRLYYSWLYTLADCNGNFEITNMRQIAGKVNPILPELTAKKLEEVFKVYEKNGLAFIWSAHRKRYIHWTGSERPGRLPAKSHRSSSYEKVLAPLVPQAKYVEFLKKNASFRDYDSARAASAAKSTAKSYGIASAASFTPEQFYQLKELCKFKCLRCGKKEGLVIGYLDQFGTKETLLLVPDHVIPFSKGGQADISNIQPLCELCNNVKFTTAKDFRDTTIKEWCKHQASLVESPTLGEQALASDRALVLARGSGREKNPAQASPSLSVFDKFWQAYPRKVGKPSAQRAWKKSHQEHKGTALQMTFAGVMAGLERWKQTEQWQVIEHIPHPATFLNDQRWKDEPPTTDRGPESTVGRGPGTEGKPGKCSDCGTEIPAGFLKCLKCIKKKAPVNP